MLISAVLNFSTIEFHVGNDLPFIMFLPDLCGDSVVSPQTQKSASRCRLCSRKSEKFAFGEYANALMKGDALTLRERELIVEKLARYTGLSAEFIERTDLRITDQHFFKELLRERGQTIGRLDSRFIGLDRSGRHRSSRI